MRARGGAGFNGLGFGIGEVAGWALRGGRRCGEDVAAVCLTFFRFCRSYMYS